MLTIIAGKPGSGKTYHMMSVLVDKLVDFANYELKHGEKFVSSIWTNIPVHIDGMNETVSSRVGKKVDITDYIHFCNEDFFQDENCVYWWQKFPEKSLIVVDEVHHYLGRSVEYGSIELETELINFLSTHRHSHQEIYFLTQHTDQFCSQILGIAEQLFEVVNAKNMQLPFPLSLPMSDIDEVLRSFGIKNQYYQLNIGAYRGKAVKWSGASVRHLMTEEIFRVYQSHMKSDDTDDHPSLQRSRLEALLWFCKRHYWHLVPKAVVAAGLVFYVPGFLFSLPEKFIGGAVRVNSAAVSKEKTKDVNGSAAPVSVAPSAAAAAAQPAAKPELSSEVSKPVQALSKPAVTFERPKIVLLYEDSVVMNNGERWHIGDDLIVAGSVRREKLKSIDVVKGVVLFESGFRIRF
jgi:hypothetical protein